VRHANAASGTFQPFLLDLHRRGAARQSRPLFAVFTMGVWALSAVVMTSVKLSPYDAASTG
jgi:hypothetical protein